ncbi:MAG: polysaccharide deacetylase family protein [Candidatus Omnitrophica bacterium]|nr:polysaccharide deacetylase family protein [Candidatus Omnitrophota bacterium]
MKKRITKGLLWLGVLSFLILATGFVLLPSKGYIPVLMYHVILPEKDLGRGSLNVGIRHFQRQMWFLKTFGFHPISLDELYAIKTGQAEPKGREVVVTFDDGHRSYLKEALPVMERYGIPSANFLIWDHLNNRFWKDYMTLEEAKSIAEHPLVTFGSHTLTHPDLPDTGRAQAEVEIVESRKRLEESFDQTIDYFCYPSGLFNEDIIQLVEAAGYKMAFTTKAKRLRGHPESLYSLLRLKVKRTNNLFIFWLHVSGISDAMERAGLFFRQLTGNKQNDTLSAYQSHLEMT